MPIVGPVQYHFLLTDFSSSALQCVFQQKIADEVAPIQNRFLQLMASFTWACGRCLETWPMHARMSSYRRPQCIGRGKCRSRRRNAGCAPVACHQCPLNFNQRRFDLVAQIDRCPYLSSETLAHQCSSQRENQCHVASTMNSVQSAKFALEMHGGERHSEAGRHGRFLGSWESSVDNSEAIVFLGHGRICLSSGAAESIESLSITVPEIHDFSSGFQSRGGKHWNFRMFHRRIATHYL